MGRIVQMPARSPSRPASAHDVRGATILFFTGVRYERDVDVEQVEDMSVHMLPSIETLTQDTTSHAVS